MKWVKGLGVLVCVALLGAAVWLWTPSSEKPDADTIRDVATSYDARIIRDTYGVAHIFGPRDRDTAFGLGYSIGEDDWTTLQDVVIAARGMSAQYYGIAARGMSAQYYGKDKAPPDYLFDLFKIREAVDAKIDAEVDPAARAMAKAYADGLNLWAVENPEAVWPNVLPITDIDIIAGFTWATPFFYRMDFTLAQLFAAGEKPKVSPWEREAFNGPMPPSVRGSNAFAIAPSRSADGHTRLIINSHQPYTGPYAWFEAHMVSEEGLNLAGASFPGSPVLSQGVTPHHGWGQTVNRPDLVDIYALDVNRDKDPTQYRLDGEWQSFERSQSRFRVKLWGPFSLPVKRDILWSKHGPVLSTDTGHYAIRFAGLQSVTALEQWYKMGKAQSFDEWKSALSQLGVLSFNIIYADRNGNISAQYNARMPDRIDGPDWQSILPGDSSDLIWDSYRSLSDMPVVTNPESGWVFSANATPFNITDPSDNNERSDYSETFGIETRVTNRSRQALDLIVNDPAVTEDALLAYRADDRYHQQSALRKMVDALVADIEPEDSDLKDARAVLAAWDGRANRENRNAALPILTGMMAMGFEFDEDLMPPRDALKATISELLDVARRLDPEWGQINRIRRGEVDLPLDGGPDTLRAVYGDRAGFVDNQALVAYAGDTHIIYADWAPNGELEVRSVHQFGAATQDTTSVHYSDQVQLFSDGSYKRMPMTLEEVLSVATRDYRPGQDLTNP